MSKPNRFEGSSPILRVDNLQTSIAYYTQVLGFKPDWSDDVMCSVSRDSAAMMLCQGAQGQPGTWVWIGVEDAGLLYEEYKASGAVIHEEPVNYYWAYEFRVRDPDGHILRFGSEPLD